MKTLKLYVPNLTKTFFLIAFSCLAAIACSDSSTDAEPEPEPEPQPPAVSFASGDVAAEETFSYTFENEGSVEYFCEYHIPGMQGVVNVSAGADISGQTTVSMENMEFVPAEITITPGTEVTWVNNSQMLHTVTSGNPDTGGDDDDPRY